MTASTVLGRNPRPAVCSESQIVKALLQALHRLALGAGAQFLGAGAAKKQQKREQKRADTLYILHLYTRANAHPSASHLISPTLGAWYHYNTNALRRALGIIKK